MSQNEETYKAPELPEVPSNSLLDQIIEHQMLQNQRAAEWSEFKEKHKDFERRVLKKPEHVSKNQWQKFLDHKIKVEIRVYNPIARRNVVQEVWVDESKVSKSETVD